MISKECDPTLWRKQNSFLIEFKSLSETNEFPLTETKVGCLVVKESFKQYAGFAIATVEVKVP